MVLQNSNNQSFSNNADGFSLGGGLTTRTLTLAGADFSLLLNSVGSGDLVQFNGTNWINVPGTSVGTGSVTSISVAGSNGISVGGSPITSAGTITLTLGNITPTSIVTGAIAGSTGTFTGNVNVTGTLSASNISGTNTGDQTITLTGDVTGSGTGSFATTLATVNTNVGTFTALTVNGKGLVTAATNLVATGDATGTASGASIALTLGTSGVTAGTYGSASSYPTFSVDSKGRVTAAGTVALGNLAFQNANNVNITGGTITGMSNPVNPSDVANKAYVDGVAAGIDAKQSVVAATVGSNIALDGSVTTLDGVTLTTGERVLVKDQTDPTQNGIYIVNTSGAWTRSTDMASGENAEANFAFVAEGSANAGKGFVVYNTPAVVGTDPINWTQFSEVGAYGATVNGGLVLGTGTPADFAISFDNLVGAGTISLSTNVLVSNDGITPVSTTVGSIATLITGGSALNAAVTSGSTASALTYNSGTFTLNVDGTSVQNSSTGLAVIVNGSTVINTPTGISIVAEVGGGLSTGPGGLSLDIGNLNSITNPLNSSDTLPIQDVTGGTTGSITLGSLATYVGTTSIFGTGAITVTGGTVALVTDGEFSQTGGTLSLGDITPNSVTSAGSVSGSLISGAIIQNSGIQVIYAADGTTIVKTGGDSGTVALAASGVTQGTYGDDTHPAIVTVDNYGRVITASTGTIALGTGSVTSITVTGSNGIGVTGSPITNSGTIALTLGDITPGNINATGTIAANNFSGTSSGTNTGDQTINLTGDVTGSGTGSITTTLANSGVTPGTYSSVVVNAKGLVTSGTSSDLQWVDVTGTTQALVPNTGYMTDNTALVTLTLPLTANFGDVIPVVGFGSGMWEIAQNPGQIIHFGNRNTTSGTTGGLIAVNRFDCVELFCAVANTEFVVRNSVGNISIV